MPRITPRSAEELLLAKRRRDLRVLARKIKSGEPLSDGEQVLASVVIKAWADQCMKWQPPKRRRGREANIDHAAVAFRFAWLIHGDYSGAPPIKPTPAIDAIAEDFNISENMVKKIIRARGEEAQMWVAGEVKPKGKRRTKIKKPKTVD